MAIKINWTNFELPLWAVEKKAKKVSNTGLKFPIAAGPPNLANGDYQTNTVDPFEAVTRIKNIVGQIASFGQSCLALKAYAIALQAQAVVLPVLNSSPLLVSKVYFDKALNLPSYSPMLADLVSYCSKFEPEPMLKAVLDSFSGWSVLAVQKFEDCRCNGDPVTLELKIRVHHSHEVKNSKFFIEQLLGIESENKEHLQKHYGGFNQKSVADPNIQIVSISRISIQLQGEYGHVLHNSYEFKVEEEKHSDQIDINAWQTLLENLSIQGVPLDNAEKEVSE
ncbi:MAG: hypothetical protein HYX21_00635 [Candidatus Yanofskybacteria bacterium]|nr:hypothetical protein [Candidatus Yanofskybacteria bacterium]